MWQWTVTFSRHVTRQLIAMNAKDRHEVETALQNQQWPVHTLSKAMGRIGTSLYPINTDNYRILCSLDESAKTVTVEEIGVSRRPY